jgi:hypothetical protein
VPWPSVPRPGSTLWPKRWVSRRRSFMLNINPCGFGGSSNSTDLRGEGLFLLPCYRPALSQTGRCDPQTSGAQIQREGHRQRSEYDGPAGPLACCVVEGTPAVEFVWYRKLLP